MYSLSFIDPCIKSFSIAVCLSDTPPTGTHPHLAAEVGREFDQILPRLMLEWSIIARARGA
jgi:hypothetical protein